MHALDRPLPLLVTESADSDTMKTPGLRSIRVLHVVSGDLWAGAETQVRNLVAVQCTRDDVMPYVAVLNEGDLACRLLELGVPLEVIDERRHSAAFILLRLFRLMRWWRIDIVHTHRQKEHILGAVAACLCGIQSLRTIHGAPESVPSRADIRRRLLRVFDRAVARYLQKCVVAVSENLAEHVRGWLEPDRVRVIGNGIDLSGGGNDIAQAHGKGRVDELSTTVGFFGRLVPVKRVDILIGAAAILKRQLPGRFRFAIHGDGPDRARLEVHVHDLGLAGTVEFHGFVDDPVRHMAACDVILLTSDHEGLPTAVLEAMHAGTPVIARAVGGIPAVLGNGAYGTLLDSAEPAEFARTLAHYHHEPEAYLAAAQAGRIAVRQYSATCMATRYTRLYRELEPSIAGIPHPSTDES